MISNQLIVFILIRITFSLLIFFIYPFYSSQSFVFLDLDYYANSLGELTPFYMMPNPLFSGFIRLIRYSTEFLLHPNYIILAMFLNIVFSSIYIYIATKILSKRNSFFYSTILGLHPYLAFYSLKIDTSLFAILPIGLICTSVFLYQWQNIRLLFISISSLFRNAMMPLGWIIVLKENKNLKYPFYAIGLIILTLSTIIHFNYAFNYLSEDYGCYSISNITNWLISLNLGNQISVFLSYLVTPIIHLLLDLSSREAISLYCLNIPKELAGTAWIHLGSTILFLIFHGFLIFKLVKFVYLNFRVDKKYFELLFPLSILLPTFYGAAHMRYLIPLIPMLILFLFKFEINQFEKERKNYLQK